MASLLTRMLHAEAAQNLLSVYGLEHNFQGTIIDTKLPLGGMAVGGVGIKDIVICEDFEFLDKNPIINEHLSKKRHELHEQFYSTQ